MTTPQEIVGWVIENFEGFSYTDDPVDTGGATKFGITLRTLAYWRMKNLGQPTSKADVKALTFDVAVQVGIDVFMRETGILDIVLPRTQLAVFDFGFHSGMPNAITGLQKALVEMGALLDVDGKLGPKTLAEVNITGRDDLRLALFTLTEREEFMQNIMIKKQTQRRFMLGWWARTTKLQRAIIKE